MTPIHKKGFTLIELLVVIAIIGVLASIVLASLDSSRKKGRDAKRLSDVKQLQLALELYYDNNNAFPVGGGSNAVSATNDGYCLTSAQLETPGYISKIPTDPISGTCYTYVPYGPASCTAGSCSVCVGYHLGTTLETVGHNQLSQDVDLQPNSTTYPICTATGAPASGDFNGLSKGANCLGATGNSSTETCYDVRP